MTTYVFTLTMKTGSDEFWEDVERTPGMPNVQMLKEEIECTLGIGFVDFDLKLKSMTVELD